MATRQPVSREIIEKAQEAALNPQLKKCGRMKICEGCEIGAYAQVIDTTHRVAARLKDEI